MVGRVACKQALQHRVCGDFGWNTKMIAMQALQQGAAFHARQQEQG